MKKFLLPAVALLIGIGVAFLIQTKSGQPITEAGESKNLTSENMKTLVIVDFQYDFADSNGSLYVKGAEEAQKNVVELIRKGGFDQVILTRDWHKTCDKSFKENGGIWPVHCVEDTPGAQVMDEIINALNEVGANYVYSNNFFL
jgi:nicotinamidase-related amidase